MSQPGESKNTVEVAIIGGLDLGLVYFVKDLGLK
jgi:hypothetical protein